ncbi:IgGFc-binding protein-like [Mytilus californianus]|uniref:IgGFc-binding protein-like n=1 Tax=Mytilus californianus TaxID=6549 RepID=UPI002247DEF6|nr:IgGFc-binding protein-like [Mytilus californianus]
MAIPNRYLSTNYLLPSFKVYSSSANSALTITTTEDRTTVKINLRMEKGPLQYKNVNYNNNDVISLVLNRFHSFKLSHSSDLSGTTIQATKPVSVLTSSIHNQVTGNDNLNELLEMVLPLNQIDNFYVIPEIVTRPSSTVRVYCPKETTLSLHDGNNRLTRHVDERKFIDFTHRKISYIHDNRDFLVMIIPHELPKGTGTVFMMTIHGVNQYMSNYDFAVPAIDDLKSHITVCVKSSALDGFTLDGQLTTIDGAYNISNGTDHYSTFSLPISPGQHYMNHTGGTRFGLWVYGENTLHDAYGYPAGIAFKTNR